MSKENLAGIMQQVQFDPSLQQKLAAEVKEVHTEEVEERELEDGELEMVSGGVFNDALADLKNTNAEVTALNAEMQVEQARHTTLNKAIDSMNESVVKAGSTRRI